MNFMIEKNEYDNGLTAPHIVIDLRNTEDNVTITMPKQEYLWFKSRGRTDEQIFQIGIALNDEKGRDEQLNACIEKYKNLIANRIPAQ